MTRLDKTLLSASFIALFPAGFLLPLYAVFVKNIGGDILDAGIAYGLFSISGGLFVLFITRTKFFTTRLRYMVVLGYLLLTIGEAGYFFVNTPLQLFMIQIIIGIAAGILDPSWDSLFSTNKSEIQAVRSWSFWSAGERIIMGLGAIVGAGIVGLYSFNVLFGLMLVCNIVAVLISLRLVMVKGEK
jgi:MFS family permease